VRKWCHLFNGGRTCAQWSVIWIPACHHRGYERQGWYLRLWKQAIHYWWASWRFPVCFAMSSMRLSQFSSDTEKFVPDGFQERSQMNTSRNAWMQLCYFWNATTEWVMNFCTISSLEMRLGSRTLHQRVRGSKNDIMPTVQPKKKKNNKIQADMFNCKNHGQRFLGQERHSSDWLLAPWGDH
jgi:hypothetical protein